MPKRAVVFDDHGRTWLTVSQLVRDLGHSRERVLSKLSQEGITKNEEGYISLVDAVVLFRHAGPERQFTNEHERLSSIRADREALKLEADRLAVVHSDDMRRSFSMIIKPVTEVLGILPQVLERDAGLDGETAQKCEHILDAARVKLHSDLAEVVSAGIEADHRAPSPDDESAEGVDDA